MLGKWILFPSFSFERAALEATKIEKVYSERALFLILKQVFWIACQEKNTFDSHHGTSSCRYPEKEQSKQALFSPWTVFSAKFTNVLNETEK